MKILQNLQKHLNISIAAILVGTAVPALCLESVQEVPSITYVTGGIGEDDTKAMEAIRNKYNLHITLSKKDGAFIADATLAIFDRSGNELLTARVGPLFYALLPPGRYVVLASSENARQTKNITITRHRASDVHFNWNYSP